MYETVADALASCHDIEKTAGVWDWPGRGFDRAAGWAGQAVDNVGGRADRAAQAPFMQNLASWADPSQVNPARQGWLNTVAGLGGAAVHQHVMRPHVQTHQDALSNAQLQREVAQSRTPYHRATAGLRGRYAEWSANRELAKQHNLAEQRAAKFRHGVTGLTQALDAPADQALNMFSTMKPKPPSGFWNKAKSVPRAAMRIGGGVLGAGLAGAGAFGTTYALSRRPQQDPQHEDFMDQYYY